MTRAWAVVGLLAIVSIPHLVDLDRPGLTYDEYYDLEDSRRFCTRGNVFAPASDGYLNGQAPFIVACAAYGAFGADEVTARGLAAGAGLLAVLATFLLAERFLRTPWALLAAAWLGFSPFFLSASRLAFSHGHVFAVAWLLLALRETLASRLRLDTARTACVGGLLAGFAAGNDLLAAPWALTLAALALRRSGGRAATARRARFLTLFGATWMVGLVVASPMYAAHPLRAAYDVADRLAWWDSQQGHLWLGAEVASLPAYYYALVLLVKVSPPVLLLFVLALRRRPSLAARVCLPCLWPVLLLTLKGWKSPFYLTPFLPLLYIVAAASLQQLVRALARPRRGWVAAAAALTVAVQLALAADSHPDHLMTGIRYGPQLYGDFAGPAVSHGQWVLEALERVRRDAGRGDAVVVVPLGYAPRQVAFYSARLGLRRVHTADRLRHGVNPRSVEYVVVSHDVLTHAEGRRFNRALLSIVADATQFRPLATVRSSGFPMARIWKRAGPVQQGGGGRREGMRLRGGGMVAAGG